MKRLYLFNIATILAFWICTMCLSSLTVANSYHGLIQDDTVKAPDTDDIPIIDGASDDDCWKTVKWQNIDQVWIDYGKKVDSTDYFGRYKIVWSSKENLLYFVVEITDDVFIGNFVYNVNPSTGGGYPDYDIVEVFIDENKSGGLHVFDNSTSWGKNAENAFSYHIAANAPADGETQTTCVVCDIAGTDWSYPKQTIPNYANHFPEFALTKNGNIYTWEFALKVYNDTYDKADPEKSRVLLTENKLAGLSLAYCDNDAPDKLRDNFFGSVFVMASRYNEHWKDATDFGKLKLTGKVATQIERLDNNADVLIYPNPTGDFLTIELFETANLMTVEIFDIFGKLLAIKTISTVADNTNTVDLSGLSNGVYVISVTSDNRHYVNRIIKAK